MRCAAERLQQFRARRLPLHQDREVHAGLYPFRCIAQRPVAGKQQKGAAAGQFQYRQCRLHHRRGIVIRTRVRHLPGQVQQGLAAKIKRAGPGATLCLLQPQLPGVVIEAPVYRQGGRGIDALAVVFA